MLFVLTGNIQSGKTRWLCETLKAIEQAGFAPFGVAAPGVWRDPAKGADAVYLSGGYECDEVAAIDWANMPAGMVDKNGYEKMGIANTLVPQDESLLFALRRDVALAAGRLDEDSQSEKAHLFWHMFDDAIDAVDAHFERAAEIGVLEAAREAAPERMRDARQALLVVDELGLLELKRDGGLVNAVKLLEKGPTPECQHALVVVRSQLSYLAEERFADKWNGYLDVYPGTASPGAIIGALRVSQKQICE